MYDFLTGPALYLSAGACLAGLAYQTISLLFLSSKKSVNRSKFGCETRKSSNYPSVHAIRQKINQIHSLLLSRNLFLAAASMAFHAALLVTPLFLLSHNIMIHACWGVKMPSLPEKIADVFTMIVLISAAFLLSRRIFKEEVRALTGLRDWMLMGAVLLPFITGFMAYHSIGDYDTVMLIHILAGELLLVLIGWTRLGHGIFFVFGRILVPGEYALGRGGRTWDY